MIIEKESELSNQKPLNLPLQQDLKQVLGGEINSNHQQTVKCNCVCEEV